MSGYHHSLHKRNGSTSIIGIIASSDFRGLFLIASTGEGVFEPYLLMVFPQGNPGSLEPVLARGWEDKDDLDYDDFDDDDDDDMIDDDDDFFDDDYSDDEDDDFDVDDDYDDEFDVDDEDDF